MTRGNFATRNECARQNYSPAFTQKLREMLSQFLCNKAGVIQLAKGLFGFQKDLHTFRKTEKMAFKFPKVNASGKEGRKSLPLFSTGKSKLLIFFLYFSLHNKADNANWAMYFLLSFS